MWGHIMNSTYILYRYVYSIGLNRSVRSFVRVVVVCVCTRDGPNRFSKYETRELRARFRP